MVWLMKILRGMLLSSGTSRILEAVGIMERGHFLVQLIRSLPLNHGFSPLELWALLLISTLGLFTFDERELGLTQATQKQERILHLSKSADDSFRY